MLTPNWLATTGPEDRLWLNELPVPTVLVERRAAAGTPAAELDSVSSDHHHGVLLALRHLAALGHDTVALAARRDTWTALQVRGGYAEGCETLGLRPRPVIDIEDPATAPESVARQLAEAVDQGVRAALVHNDQDAIQLPALLRARPVRPRGSGADQLRRRLRGARRSAADRGGPAQERGRRRRRRPAAATAAQRPRPAGPPARTAPGTQGARLLRRHACLLTSAVPRPPDARPRSRGLVDRAIPRVRRCRRGVGRRGVGSRGVGRRGVGPRAR